MRAFAASVSLGLLSSASQPAAGQVKSSRVKTGRLLTRLFVVSTLALFAGGCDPEWATWPAEIQPGPSELRRDPETGRWVFLVPRFGETDSFDAFGPFAPGWVGPVEHFQTEDGARYVLETTEEGGDGSSSCVVRFIDPGPPPSKVREYRVSGSCGEFKLDERLHRKGVLTNLEEGRRILLIDYVTGEKLGDLPIPAPTEGRLEHIQLLAQRWVLIIDAPPDACRVVVLDLQGVVLATFTLPGKFSAAIDGGEHLKAITTSRGEVTFNDLVDVELLKKAEPGAGLVPGAPLPGAPTDLQHHQVEGQDRFVQTSVVWSGSPASTSVRLFDGSGRRVRDLVFRGTFEAAVDLHPYKMFIIDHTTNPDHPMTDVFLVDLRTGALVGQPSPTVLDGKYRSVEPDEARKGASVTVIGSDGEITTSISVP